ncbi:MAG: hypothetical protein J5800_09130 [Spirochaetales bacterium]|nr:hypothetical protein [Spirochaetales bacterium]
MARKLIIFLSIILAVVLSSCQSVPDDLVVMETSDVELSFSRGSTVATITRNDIEYQIIGNNVEDGEGSFLVSIKNNSDKPYDFKDSDVVIFGGKHKWGLWKTLETWDAKSYYNAAVQECRSGVFWASLAGVMMKVDAILGIVADRHYSSRPYYSPGDGLVASMVLSRAALDSVRSNGDEYLKYLESNLLFSSTIAPGETYTGWVFFDARKYEYYKIEITPDNRRKTFSIVMHRESL